jgi:antitoxin Phd
VASFRPEIDPTRDLRKTSTSGLAVAVIPAYMTTVVILGGVPFMREIQLRDAKASLSAVVDEAVQGKPAVITRHGKRQAVVVSYEEWERLSHVPTFGRLLMAAPLTADDLPSRNKSGLRKTGL